MQTNLCTLSTAGTTVVVTCPVAIEDRVVVAVNVVVSTVTDSVTVFCAKELAGVVVGLVVTEVLVTATVVSISSTTGFLSSVFVACSSFVIYTPPW